MNDRTARFAARHAATRHLLAWFGVAAAGVTLAALAIGPAAAAEPRDEAMLLRGGLLAAEEARGLPRGGWFRVTSKPGHLHVQPVAVPANEDAEAGRWEGIDTVYVRLPGVAVAQGRVPAARVEEEGGTAHALVADLDSDGKPDLLVRDGADAFLLLSSRAPVAATGRREFLAGAGAAR